MNTIPFSGTITALTSPFTGAGKDVCVESLEQLITYQLQAGIDGLVILGTTGESPTLRYHEREVLAKQTLALAKGVIPVIVGAGANSTQETVERVIEAEKWGADAILLVAPYYNKPTQEGLFHHFSYVATHTSKPILLYSHPGRCGIEIDIDTVARLHEKYSHICGLKEVGGSCDRLARLRLRMGNQFSLLSGEDSLTLPFLASGANGVISVISNAFPQSFKALVSYALMNDFNTSLDIHFKLFPLIDQMAAVATNPIPIKQILFDLKIIKNPDVRLPLVSLNSQEALHLSQILHKTLSTLKQEPVHA